MDLVPMLNGLLEKAKSLEEAHRRQGVLMEGIIQKQAGGAGRHGAYRYNSVPLTGLVRQ
jgi:hypothetical protein